MASTSKGTHSMQGLSSSPQQYDYNEGVSATEVSKALASTRHSRRNSNYSIDEEGDGGAVFDGPGHKVNPSSVSRMGRRSSSADYWGRSARSSHSSATRPKFGARASRESVVMDDCEDGLYHERQGDIEEGLDARRLGGGRRRSLSPIATRTSVLENLTHLFRSPPLPHHKPVRQRSQGSIASSRRPPPSRRSDAGSDETDDDDAYERWGYSSGEEDLDSVQGNEDSVNELDSQLDSYPPSPGTSLPLLSSDHIFGRESPIEIKGVLPELDPPPPGPPSRQTIYIADEDSTIRFIGYKIVPWKSAAWICGSIATFGVLPLLGRWFPKLWLRWVTLERAFKDIKNGLIVVEVRAMPCSHIVSSYLKEVQD